MSNVTWSHVLLYGVLTMALFAYFQHADSILPKPVSMTIPVLTITAANKVMKQVVDGTAGGRTSKH